MLRKKNTSENYSHTESEVGRETDRIPLTETEGDELNGNLPKRRKLFKRGRIRMKKIKVNNPILGKALLTTMKQMGADKDLLKKAENRELTKEELKVWFDEQRSRLRKRETRNKTEMQMDNFEAIAKKTGYPVAELISRAMDEWLEKDAKKERKKRKEVKQGKVIQSKKKGR